MMKLQQKSRLMPLYHRIEAHQGKSGGKLIVLLSCYPGEGASTVAMCFAELCGDILGRSVVVVEEEDSVNGEHPSAIPCRQMSVWPKDSKGSDPIRARPGFCTMSTLNEAKEKFEYVLFVSKSMTHVTTALSIAQHADGVIMIIESESTSWKTCRWARDQIIGSGGTLLGVVLNKRKHHLPDWLRRFL